MLDANPQIDQFKQQLRNSLQHESCNARKLKIAKHEHVYTCGDAGETIYFIESGQIKMLMVSPQGKECLLAIYTAGDIFGESCLSGLSARIETAIAMEDTQIKQISSPQFFSQLSREGLYEGFVQYLTVRIAEQQELIANLVTVDSEQRLGKTLLYVAHKLGRKEVCDVCNNVGGICIEHKISHEELAEMVGTTRPRISVFMQRFRHLGLIETSTERFLIINENKLSAYLSQIA